MPHFDSSHSFVTRCSRVSRAPPRHTLHAFLNLMVQNMIDRIKRS